MNKRVLHALDGARKGGGGRMQVLVPDMKDGGGGGLCLMVNGRFG